MKIYPLGIVRFFRKHDEDKAAMLLTASTKCGQPSHHGEKKRTCQINTYNHTRTTLVYVNTIMPQKRDIKTNICKVCNKLVRDNQKGMNCNISLCWYHSKCICMP